MESLRELVSHSWLRYNRILLDYISQLTSDIKHVYVKNNNVVYALLLTTLRIYSTQASDLWTKKQFREYFKQDKNDISLKLSPFSILFDKQKYFENRNVNCKKQFFVYLYVPMRVYTDWPLWAIVSLHRLTVLCQCVSTPINRFLSMCV